MLLSISHLSEEMQEQIRADLQMLDDTYGADRDIDHSLGGFVAVIEDDNYKKRLKEYYLDIDNDVAEYSDEYNGFTESLYLISDDYSVVVFVRK